MPAGRSIRTWKRQRKALLPGSQMQSQFCVPCLLCGNGNTYALTAAVIVICACIIYTGPETAGYESVFLWAADVRTASCLKRTLKKECRTAEIVVLYKLVNIN